MTFPAYAYPTFTAADVAFRAEIEEYNATAADTDKIEIVGDTKMLEFAPLDESWFMESGNSDLDAIVGFCAATTFIYPAMKSAIANGTCSADTKLLGGGFETGSDIIADIGGDGVIQRIEVAPIENTAWSIIMLDSALNGTMYSDYKSSEQIDSVPCIIDSTEDINNVMSKSLFGTADPANAQLTFDDLKTVLTRYTPDATYAQLKALFQSDKLLVSSLK